MSKYLIKKTYTATENNPNFKGVTQVWYYGSYGRASRTLDNLIKRAAYTTKSSLSNGLKFMKYSVEDEESCGFWKIDLDVVEV